MVLSKENISTIKNTMPINENQLVTWSHQGAVQSSANTYNSIKTCIEGINWNADISYEIYLQGSYKNTTNIRGNSDVDVVVEFKSIFYSNKNELPPDQLKAFNEYHEDGKYTLKQFKDVIIKELASYYGERMVREGNKSINVKGNGGRLDADVVCCAQYREYRSFSRSNPTNYIRGITFWQKNDGKQIRNFPNPHYDNGVSKNKESGSKYKPTIRIFKNMKARLVELNRINSSLAPSYYVECLLYNVASRNFNQSYFQDIIGIVLDYLAKVSDDGGLSKLICQNECRSLFSGIDPHWDEEHCKSFLQQIIILYNEG